MVSKIPLKWYHSWPSLKDISVLGESYWFHNERYIQTDRFPIILSYYDCFEDQDFGGKEKMWVIINGKYESIYEFTLNGAPEVVQKVLFE